MRRFLASVVFFTTAMAAGGATAQPIQAKHSRVELLSQQGAPATGTEILLGVHFILEPGWHIYWINPGDSGQPPSFRWQLPEGFSVGEVKWPRPERMQSSPQLADYGYHGQTLLVVPIRVPQHWRGPAAEIGLEVKWLICRDICLPDRAQLHLTLSAGSAPGKSRDSSALFDAALKLVPKPLPSGWKAVAVSRHDDFVLTLETPMHVMHAQFFPLVPAQLDNAALQKTEVVSHGIKIVLRKSELLVKPVPVLLGVLVLDGDAYQIEAPVTAQKE
jgi:thiol:disulfide interchange protein DsbD